MKLLILGGTRFVGRHITEEALRHGHDVTLFNRGRIAPHGFPDVRLIRGDRRVDVSGLALGRWDCAIDVSGYLPGEVCASAEMLRGHAQHYVFISSVSVYPDSVEPGADENSPLLELPLGIDDSHPLAYGGCKANCERVLQDIWSDAWLSIIRPTIAVGPHDPTDRFTYWVRRISQGGRLVVPLQLHRPVQLIDARDLAHFVLDVVEQRFLGTFNACGPDARLHMGGLLEHIAHVVGAGLEPVHVEEHVLAARDVYLPFTVRDDRSVVLFQVSNRRARDAGLRLRPLGDSVSATLEWDRQRGQPPMVAGIHPDLESEILAGL